jgi:adenylate cyclase
MGAVRLRQQRYDEAATNFARAIAANPRFSWLYAFHAAALAMAGRVQSRG